MKKDIIVFLLVVLTAGIILFLLLEDLIAKGQKILADLKSIEWQQY